MRERMTKSTEDHLYATHRALTEAMFLRGLTAAERRRLSRVRRTLDALGMPPAWRWYQACRRRHGRAWRIAWRKWKHHQARAHRMRTAPRDHGSDF